MLLVPNLCLSQRNCPSFLDQTPFCIRPGLPTSYSFSLTFPLSFPTLSHSSTNSAPGWKQNAPQILSCQVIQRLPLLFVCLFNSFLIRYFFYLSPSWSTLWLFHPPSPRGCPQPYPTRLPHFLGPWGLCAFSLTDSRPGSPLLYMCWEPHIRWYMLPGWWSSVWDIPRLQISWHCWSSCRVTLLLSFFQLLPNSTTGVTSFCPLVGCLHLLALLAACWAPKGGQSW